MTPRPPERFKLDLLLVLAQIVKGRFQAATKSRTLRRAWTVGVDRAAPTATRVLVWVPHYWAWPYFLGRRAVHPRVSKKLAWFRDPRDDPRIQPRAPVRLRERVRLPLPSAQFWALVRSGKLLLRDSAGPAAPQHGFLAEAGRVRQTLTPTIGLVTKVWLKELVPVQPHGGRVARATL
jgi:hypothetical protein